MITRRHCLLGVPALMSGCVTINGNDSIIRVGQDITRQDFKGDMQVLRSDGTWASAARPEANITRPTVWYLTAQESGFKAWRFGWEHEQNVRYVDPLSPIVEVGGFSATGWATYLVKGNGFQDYVVRRVNFIKSGQPETIGHLEAFEGSGVSRPWMARPRRPTTTTSAPGASYFCAAAAHSLISSHLKNHRRPHKHWPAGVISGAQNPQFEFQ